MLELRTNTEDWREQIVGYFSEEQLAGADVDSLADELRDDTLRRLVDAGHEYERAYQQSRGAFVIVQAGTDAEIEAFDNALDEARAALKISA